MVRSRKMAMSSTSILFVYGVTPVVRFSMELSALASVEVHVEKAMTDTRESR